MSESDERVRLVADLSAELVAAIPGSAVLRGSLAEGCADPYCDVNLLWDVPDAAFAEAIASLPVFMARVRPLASLRFDPDFQHSTRRRLAFVRFAGVPLFSHVDLDVLARSVSRDPDYDHDNPSAGAPPGHSLRAAWPMQSRPSKLSGVAGILRPPNS